MFKNNLLVRNHCVLTFLIAVILCIKLESFAVFVFALSLLSRKQWHYFLVYFKVRFPFLLVCELLEKITNFYEVSRDSGNFWEFI